MPLQPVFRLNRCTHEIVKVTLQEAKERGYTACYICYKGAVASLLASPVRSKAISGQCQAITRKGTRCSPMARLGGYCWQHGEVRKSAISQCKPYNPNTAYGRRKCREAQHDIENLLPAHKADVKSCEMVILLIIVAIALLIFAMTGDKGVLKWLS